MNSPEVVAKMRSINANVKLELANAGALTGQPNINLVPLWDSFLAQHFTDSEAYGRSWLKARMPETKKEIQATMTKYRKMYRLLKQRESSTKATQYAKAQKMKNMQLDKVLLNRKRIATAAKQKVAKLKTTRKPGMSTAAKKTLERAITNAKLDEEEAKKQQGLTQRKIHELYAHSVLQILDNLKKDSARVANFEKAINGLRLTRP